MQGSVLIVAFITLAAALAPILDTFSALSRRNGMHHLQNSRKTGLRELGVPNASISLVEFGLDENHYNITSDTAWESLVPVNKGIITVTPDSTNDHTVKMQVALYQQLDCLNTIRKSVLHLYNVEEVQNPILPDFKKTQFCFGALRQALLCACDITLESPEHPKHGTDGSVGKLQITGLGIVHKCSSWEKVRIIVKDF